MFFKRSSKTGGRILDDKGLVDEFVSKELSRRQMVQAVMLGTVGTWLGASGLAACGAPTGNNPGDGGTMGDGGAMGDAAPQDSGPPRMPHLVGMGYSETSQEEAVRRALDETVGLGMIRRGDSVYFKVNTNSGDPFPYSTSPELILQLGGMLRDMGVTDIRIGDRSFWGDRNTAGNFASNGIADAAAMLGTTATVFDDSVDWVTLPAEMVPNWVGTVRLPAMVTTATHIINLACVKTHFIATFTMTLKNCLGLVHATDRARAGNLQTHDTRVLYQQIAQINKGYTPSLNILNGYQALITGGPTPTDGAGGTVADPKVVIVSTDRIAADVTGIAVLQTLSPTRERVTQTRAFNNPQIRAAIAAGLGITGRDAYDLSGPTVPMIETYRQRALAM
jgi:uncharacterized protein (DUF362 family)